MRLFRVNYNKLKLYSNPKETKFCLLCNKEIDLKWKDDLCEHCRDRLKLNPEKFKDILEIFKITNSKKNPQESGEGNNMTKKKPNTSEETEDKKIYVIFHKSDLVKLGLKETAKARELANYIREKIGLPELKTTRSGKKQKLIEKLGLDEDATQADINDAVMELELEE